MNAEPRTAVVALSGGMDSAILVAHYIATRHRVIAVSVDYGQRHRARELDAAAKVAAHYGAEHIVLDLRDVGRHLGGSALTDPDVPVPEGHYTAPTMAITVVPNRNMILASILIGIAVARRGDVVAMGMHAGDHAVYPDCRPEFVAQLGRLTEIATEGFGPPTVAAPFVHCTKTDIAALGRDLGVPYELTWSCYQGGPVHCGRCGTCCERAEALAEAGVQDPTEYADPDFWRTVSAR